MPVTPLATEADVAAGWRPLTTAEESVATTLLGRASAIVRTSVPGVDTRVAADEDYAELARGVVADMVKRVLMNPEAIRTSGVDDYSATRDTAVSSGALYLADMERAQLIAPASAGLAGAFVVSLGG